MWLATLASVCASAHARAEDALPLEPEELRLACLSNHEAGQLARLDGKLVEAKRMLGACAVADCPTAVRADCNQWLAEVNNAIPSVVLAATSSRGDEVSVRVFLDGAPLTDRLDGKAFELNPGHHRFRFELAPHPPEEHSLLLREGERERLVRARFVEPARKVAHAATAPAGLATTLANPRPIPWITYALGALSLTAVGTTTYFGFQALTERREKLNACAPLCSARDTRDVQRPALAADISALVAVLAGGGAIYTYWTRPSFGKDGAFIGYSGGF